MEIEENYQLNRCDLNIMPSSHDYPTKNYMVLVRRINLSILGTFYVWVVIKTIDLKAVYTTEKLWVRTRQKSGTDS